MGSSFPMLRTFDATGVSKWFRSVILRMFGVLDAPTLGSEVPTLEMPFSRLDSLFANIADTRILVAHTYFIFSYL